MTKYRKSFCIYKPRNGPDFSGGAAAQFQLGSDNSCVFLELAKQVADKESPRPYDWEHKMIVKLGQSDIGKLLVFLQGGGETLDLFHKNEKGNKVLKFTAQERGFYLKVSAKEGEGQVDAVNLPITWDEAYLLRLALERAFLNILSW